MKGKYTYVSLDSFFNGEVNIRNEFIANAVNLLLG
jgi:hypothetical protein